MFVKICGLTNLEDTLAAAESGAAAAGFNFYKGSPRFIEPEALGQWIGRVPAEMWKVGVFVNETPERVRQIAEALSLDVIQLHGQEPPADVPMGFRTWKAARILKDFDWDNLSDFDTEALLLDGPASGMPFDWKAANGRGRNIVLAGGLNAENVPAAIALVNPWGVDVCSGVESSPGRKDFGKMKRFIQTALSC